MSMKSKASTDQTAITHFLTRAVENVYPTREKLGERLASDTRITAYLGLDPTGPSLHLGHAIAIRKLAELQKLGHRVILLIGDFTAMIGDPTDKAATRKQLTREEVLVHAKHYKKQASKFLDFDGSNAVEIKYNSEWLAKMSFAETIQLASNFTVQQLMNRDMFRKREHWQIKCRHCGNFFFSPIQFGTIEAFESAVLKGNKAVCPICHEETPLEKEDFIAPTLSPIYEHEFLYPIMQGYDSVAMDVDLEIGGNDQTFNMLAGRTLMKKMRQKEKYVLTTKLLVDSAGKKMGKTEGNMVALDDTPEDMYGKVMSWTDGMIIPGFELCTDVVDEEIHKISDTLKAGENPMNSKQRLAQEVVRLLCGDTQAKKAAEHFLSIHCSGEMPVDIPDLKIYEPMTLSDALVASKFVSSRSEARRQIEQGGVKVDGNVVRDGDLTVTVGSVIQKGKRHFVRLV